MKKLSLLPLLLIAALFMGCSHDVQGSKEEPAEVTALIVKNQSSFSIKDVKYGGKTAKLSGDYLSPSENCKIELAEKASGYVFFTLYDKVKNVSFSVRVNGAVTVEKGKTETLVITDNTLVIQTGQTVPHSILNLMKPAVLKVHNKTSWDIVEISYGGKTKEILSSGGEWNEMFSDSMKKEISIKILRKSDSTILKLTLKEEIAVKIGTVKEVEITNTTLVRQEGKTEIEELRRALGMSILTVINQTSAKSISDVRYAGKISEQILLKGEKIEFVYDKAVDDFISFQINNGENAFNVKRTNKVSIQAGEDSDIIINDETLVLYSEYKYSLQVKNLLEAACITIENKTRADVIGVVYADVNFGDLQKNTQVKKIFINFDKTPSHIAFSVFQSASGEVVAAKTVTKFSAEKRETTTFTLTDATEVIKDGTGKTIYIKNLLGFGSFTLENRTSAAAVKEVNYADYTTDCLTGSETWELDKSLDDFIFFEIKTARTSFKVKTQEKIKIDIGEEKKYTLTDETLVIPLDRTEAVSIQNLIEAAVVQILNKTSANTLTNVTYGDVHFGSIQNYKKMNLLDFKKVPSYIYFNIYNLAIGKNVGVRTVQKFFAGKNDVKKFAIKNETEVIIESTGDTTSVRKILGIGCLKIINQSTAKSISKIKFAGITHEDTVLQGNYSDFECKNTAEDYIYFSLENEFGSWNVKTKDKVTLAAGEDKTFTLTDDTFVVIENTPPAKIKSLIYAAQIEVLNKSSAELLNVSYNNPENENLGSFPINEKGAFIYWDYTVGAYSLGFEIKTGAGNIVRVKTTETRALQSKQTISFIITDKTPVIIEATGETSSVQKILGIAFLKFINQSTAGNVTDIHFAGAKYIDFVQQGHYCELKVTDTSEDFIYFFLWQSAVHVKTKDKVKLIAGGNRDFTLTNDTLVVILDTGETTSIQNILN